MTIINLLYHLKKQHAPRFGRKSLIATSALCFLAFSFTPKAAVACYSCTQAVTDWDSDIWREAQEEYDQFLDDEFKETERFIAQTLWGKGILPVLMKAAGQFTTIAMQQAMIIGMFIDAESQMDSQRLLQEIHAKTHKDYHPSVGMCEFGSLMKGIATTERRGEVTAVILGQRSLNRQLGNYDSSGLYGHNLDKHPRILQFKNLFCNEKDRGSALEHVCTSKVEWGQTSFDAAKRKRINKDIDYFTLMDSPWNLNIDFTNNKILDTSSTPNVHNEDEEHVLALAANLYGHETFPRPPARLLENKPGLPISKMQTSYLNMRSIIAKRSVAENSFYAIAALKTEGHTLPETGGGTKPMSARIYMEHILKELGVPSTEILNVLGENPSYYAQMDILTKKIYQNPDFYTNLYDKPANIKRKSVAIQAIKLMQKFDMLKSFLRGEASVSLLLELAVVDLQADIENQIQSINLIE